jgi:hypothetical protein
MKYISPIVVILFAITTLISYNVGVDHGRDYANQLWSERACIKDCAAGRVDFCKSSGMGFDKSCDEWLKMTIKDKPPRKDELKEYRMLNKSYQRTLDITTTQLCKYEKIYCR